MEELTLEEIEEGEDTQKDKYLIFTEGKEDYGLEIAHVTEIIGIQPITKVPELPEYIKGIINLRGKIIPVMDVSMRFNKPLKTYNDRTCIVVVDIQEISIGLIVDSVSEVAVISENEIVFPPESSRANNKYIKGIGKLNTGVKLILDCNQLFEQEEMETISKIS